jgi:hypothetical protein
MKTIALSLIFTAGLCATPAGVLVWKNPPVVIQDLGTTDTFGSMSASFDGSGITSSFSGYSEAQLVQTNYQAFRDFTVVVPGDFEIFNSATVTGSGEWMSPIGQVAGMSVDFTASGFGVDLSGAGAEYPSFFFDPNFISNGTYPWFPLPVTGQSSAIVFLPRGTYALDQVMSATTESINSTSMTVSFSTDITGIDPVDPVSEPGLQFINLLVLLAAVSALKLRVPRD